MPNPDTVQALQNLHYLRSTDVLTEEDFQAAKAKLLGDSGASAPAGWYDDGSGRQRWWDGRRWTSDFRAPDDRAPESSSHLLWALSPVYTFGLVSFIPALHAAFKLQRRNLWYWAAGLTAGNVIAWILMSIDSSTPNESSPFETVGAMIAIVTAVVGTIIAFRTRAEVFGPRAAADPSEGDPLLRDPAVANSLAARKRREECLALSEKDRSLARDLRIGRPDLSRQFYDGGLVDVNHVPVAVLVSHLGLSPAQARGVVEARDRLGSFVSAAELCSLADLPPQTLDAIRDRVVTL